MSARCLEYDIYLNSGHDFRWRDVWATITRTDRIVPSRHNHKGAPAYMSLHVEVRLDGTLYVSDIRLIEANILIHENPQGYISEIFSKMCEAIDNLMDEDS